MDKYKNLIQRSFSGLIFILVIIASVLWNPYSFAVLFLIITVFGLHEFYKLVYRKEIVEVNSYIGMGGGLVLFVCTFLHAYMEIPTLIYALYAIYIILVFIWELFRNKSNPINNWAYFFLGQLYVALPFSLLNYIIFINGFQPLLLLALFVTLWFNDTGAYLTGMTMGKHKLFERISPKKTWEGFFGGVAFAMIAGYLLSLFIPDIMLWQWLIFAVLVSVFGTLGDLSESLLKRTAHVKDAGNIIPGHGGILDRFDSMLLITPIILIYYMLILG